MASFNRAIIVGNLTRDPELRYTQGGLAVADVALAVNDRVKRGEDWVDEVSYLDVTFFGKSAETVNQYLTKGSPLLVEGRLKQERWEKDGQKRSKVKIIAEQMKFLESGRKEGGGGQQAGQSAGAGNQPTAGYEGF